MILQLLEHFDEVAFYTTKKDGPDLIHFHIIKTVDGQVLYVDKVFNRELLEIIPTEMLIRSIDFDFEYIIG